MADSTDMDLGSLEVNRTIHEPNRLKLMSLLAATEQLDFSTIKSILKLTDGNLSTHLRTLEEAGYVEVKKGFMSRRPKTLYRLSDGGQRAFAAYLDVLQSIINASLG